MGSILAAGCGVGDPPSEWREERRRIESTKREKNVISGREALDPIKVQQSEEERERNKPTSSMAFQGNQQLLCPIRIGNIVADRTAKGELIFFFFLRKR